ncbi:MAG: transglutaminase domain-containing protein [Bacillota bacterium]|nr:transglutaminase domain-containing protein [Bacillota bacterium]
MNRINITRFLIAVLIMGFWFLIVLYPNPKNLALSIQRLKNPPVNPFEVTDLALELYDHTPGEIKDFVYSRLPYSYDWTVYNMPWYFPTLEEVLQQEAGDCKARYVLFASILEQKEIPYNKMISLTHIWVAYEGKEDNTMENLDEALFIVDDQGKLKISYPRADLQRSLATFVDGFWRAMPSKKKSLLFAGFPLMVGLMNLPKLSLKKLLPNKKKNHLY